MHTPRIVLLVFVCAFLISHFMIPVSAVDAPNYPQDSSFEGIVINTSTYAINNQYNASWVTDDWVYVSNTTFRTGSKSVRGSDSHGHNYVLTGKSNISAYCKADSSGTMAFRIYSYINPPSGSRSLIDNSGNLNCPVGSWGKLNWSLSSGAKTLVWVSITTSNQNTYVDDFMIDDSNQTSSIPVSSFSFTPASGTQYGSANVGFTDTSTGIPTSWSWNFGDGNTTSSTLQNPSHYFNASGTYNVSLTATNALGSHTSYQNYQVLAYLIPVCSYTYNPNNGTSPLDVSFVDTSSNNPTSYVWNFNPNGDGWVTVTPNSYNTTKMPNVTITGSGLHIIAHSVSNPAGTSVCSAQYVNMSGLAPTPTPTPNIPFPNQTGICQNTPISLGSNNVKAYDRFFRLTRPDNSIYSDYFVSGVTSLVSGSSYTTQLGQYIYNEYNASSVLEYRSSYVVQDCSPTPTATATLPKTPIPSPTPWQTITYPTVTPIPKTNSTVSVPVVIPTLQPISTTLINTSTATNITVVRDRLYNWNQGTRVYTDMWDTVIGNVNSLVVGIFGTSFSPIAGVVAGGTYLVTLFSSLLNVFLPTFEIITYTMLSITNALGAKITNAITLFLCLDVITQIWWINRPHLR